VATVDENLKTYLQGDATIAKLVGVRIHENKVPMQFANGVWKPIHGKQSYIWFAYAGGESERTLGQTAGALFRYRFDLECIASELRPARQLSAAVFARLDSVVKGTTFVTQTVQGIFCEDQADDYVPKGVLGDTGMHICSMLVEVIPT
jgi:hypothetical protein